METFLVSSFVILNLFIRVPIRIAMLIKKNSEKLETADFWSTIITSFLMETMFLYACFTNQIGIGTLIFGSLLFGAFPIFLVILSAKKAQEEKIYWQNIYTQTKQVPDRSDYGLCVENPIWTGTAQFYLNHIRTIDGYSVTWKRTEIIELEKQNGFSVLNGFYACELAKYDIFCHGKHIDTFFICTKSGLDKMKVFHAPKGYKYE